MGPQRDYYLHWLGRYDVPGHMHEAYLRYLMHGLPPGHFLTAVLSNDLREACARADEENQASLHKHVRFLYNVAPSHSWGTPEKVEAWMASFRKAGEVA